MYSKLFLLRSCQLPSSKFFKTPVAIKGFHSISSKYLLRSYVPAVTHVRTFWETFPFFRPLFYEKDGLNRDKYALIYHARIFHYAFYAQLGALALLASEIYGGLQYVYKSFFAPEVSDAVTFFGPFTVNATNLSSMIAITIFNIQAIFMFIAAQNAVLRAYFSEEREKFVFVKLGLNPFKSRLLHCSAGELHPLEESPFGFLFGNHKLNREKMFIRSDNFKSTYLYNSLLSKEYKQ